MAGNAITGIRGKGYGSALEIAFIDLLKRIAKSEGKPIVRQIRDRNIHRTFFTPNRLDPEERNRWERLYGTQHDEVIQPDPNLDDNLQALEQIVLERKSYRRTEVVVKEQRHEGDLEGYQKQRMAELFKLLGIEQE